jgi:hypothetical protein
LQFASGVGNIQSSHATTSNSQRHLPIQHVRPPNATKTTVSALLLSYQRVNSSSTALFTPDGGEQHSTCSYSTSAALAAVTATLRSAHPFLLCMCAKADSGCDAHAPVVTLSFEARPRAPSVMLLGGPIMGGQDTACSFSPSCDTKEPTRHPNSDNADRPL